MKFFWIFLMSTFLGVRGETSVSITPLLPVDCNKKDYENANRLILKDILETSQQVEITFTSSFFSCENGVEQLKDFSVRTYLPYAPIGFWTIPSGSYRPDAYVIDSSSKFMTYRITIDKDFVFSSDKNGFGFKFTTGHGYVRYPWLLKLKKSGQDKLVVQFKALK